MSKNTFDSQLAFEERAEKIGKQALKLGLIPSFSIRYFPDSWEFYLPEKGQTESTALTPEEAYLKLKKMVEQSGAELSNK
ncbi:MAG: hypothetical protein WA865_10090 [Spirulinaceae cyanobacterium]